MKQSSNEAHVLEKLGIELVSVHVCVNVHVAVYIVSLSEWDDDRQPDMTAYWPPLGQNIMFPKH